MRGFHLSAVIAAGGGDCGTISVMSVTNENPDNAQWRRLILAIKYYGPKCYKCKEPRVTALECEFHRRQNNIRQREKMRKKLKLKKRNMSAESYNFK